MFSFLNGCEMGEMLKTLVSLGPTRREMLNGERQKYTREFYMARIEFAMYVAEFRQVPTARPADLPPNQIVTAEDFARRNPLPAKGSEDELILDILQFALDLTGVVDPTGLADAASAVISLSRGDWFSAGISAVSMVPYIGDMAKVGKLPKYAQTVEKAVQVAAKDEKFAKRLLPGMKKLRGLLNKIKFDQVPAAVRGQMESILHNVLRFIRKAQHLSWGEIINLARKNGSSAGQFAIERGGKRVTANVENVVELLQESRNASRSPAAKRNASALLEEMADGEWKLTAGPHPSATDATNHLTLRIEDIEKQYHVRLDADGHLFEVRHPDGTVLTDIEPWAAPGAPSTGARAGGGG